MHIKSYLKMNYSGAQFFVKPAFRNSAFAPLRRQLRKLSIRLNFVATAGAKLFLFINIFLSKTQIADFFYKK